MPGDSARQVCLARLEAVIVAGAREAMKMIQVNWRPMSQAWRPERGDRVWVTGGAGIQTYVSEATYIDGIFYRTTSGLEFGDVVAWAYFEYPEAYQP